MNIYYLKITKTKLFIKNKMLYWIMHNESMNVHIKGNWINFDFMLTLNEVSLQKEFDGGCTVCAPVQNVQFFTV